jgi:integrase/recombinase XerD
MLRQATAYLAARDASSLVAADWTAFRLSRSELSPASQNQILKYLKTLLRWGKREGYLAAVPALCDARLQPQKRHRETAPNEDEVGLLLGECQCDRDTLIVLAACDAGLRNTEIRLLQWSWIDRERMRINLPAAITKTRKARSVPMTSRLSDAIRAMPQDIRSPYVIRSRLGHPYCVDSMTILWREIARRAGIEAAPGERRVRLHDGRHGFATNAVERGVRIEVVSDILGHASLEQTRAYVQRRPRDLDKARELFEQGIERDRRKP